MKTDVDPMLSDKSGNRALYYARSNDSTYPLHESKLSELLSTYNTPKPHATPQ